MPGPVLGTDQRAESRDRGVCGGTSEQVMSLRVSPESVLSPGCTSVQSRVRTGPGSEKEEAAVESELQQRAAS
ncbi:hypothetical protein CHARACLAT_011652 [Characodon lateralis]|uniref:Uncharacterized protein n=1 Tax=Characodon lateralis TaxID=208331 RepID=A0ABU7D0D1_9TELE|nr:hypothetical protein [Characodon lateralis]